ncbi:MAG: hypothetical protein ABI969_18605 [bacterium]
MRDDKMPGYKPLPSTVIGPDADQVRQAESRNRGGNPEAAVRLLEEALGASAALRSELPGWLCGRLASLYRTLGRYDDEVFLLERYRDSQCVEEARTRYDARLYKARTIAERKRPRDSGALASVRESMDRPRRRRAVRPVTIVVEDRAVRSSPDILSQVTRAFASTSRSSASELYDALALLSADAHAKNIGLEPLVAALKQAYDAAPPSQARTRASHYDSALLMLLGFYFRDEAA